MLGNEHRMAAHRGLLSVLWRMGRSQPIPNERRAVFHDGVQSPVFQILSRLFVQMEAGSETGFLKSQEKLFGGRNAQDGSTF